MKAVLLLSFLLSYPAYSAPGTCADHVPVALAQLSAKELENAVVWMNCDPIPAKTSFKFPSSFNLISPITLNVDSYMIFVNAAPAYNWSHDVSYIFVPVMDASNIKSQNLWEALTFRHNGFPKDEIMKSKNRKLIHIGSKVPGWVTPKEKVWP